RHDGLCQRADPKTPFSLGNVERYGRTLHRDYFADQLRHVGERASQLTGPGAQDRFLLLRARLVIDEGNYPPIALHDVAGNMAEETESQTRNVRPIYCPFVDVVRQHRITGSVVGVLTDPARTQNVAIADFEDFSFELIAHSEAPQS